MGEFNSFIMKILKLNVELGKYVMPRKFTVYRDSVKVLAKLKSKNLILEILLKVNNSHKNSTGNTDDKDDISDKQNLFWNI